MPPRRIPVPRNRDGIIDHERCDGDVEDECCVGDWNGDGKDGIAVRPRSLHLNEATPRGTCEPSG
jgi:hypothetical protein